MLLDDRQQAVPALIHQRRPGEDVVADRLDDRGFLHGLLDQEHLRRRHVLLAAELIHQVLPEPAHVDAELRAAADSVERHSTEDAR